MIWPAKPQCGKFSTNLTLVRRGRARYGVRHRYRRLLVEQVSCTRGPAHDLRDPGGVVALAVRDHRHVSFVFVPLTSGLSFLRAIMASVQLMTDEQVSKDMVRFWGKLFGFNFALAGGYRHHPGITMESQFGTDSGGCSNRWSPGWLRGSKLLALGSLIANGWMQNPVGTQFSRDTMPREPTRLAEVFLNPVAQVKFVHKVSAHSRSGLGAVGDHPGGRARLCTGRLAEGAAGCHGGSGAALGQPWGSPGAGRLGVPDPVIGLASLRLIQAYTSTSWVFRVLKGKATGAQAGTDQAVC